jgi:hypothetical protein
LGARCCVLNHAGRECGFQRLRRSSTGDPGYALLRIAKELQSLEQLATKMSAARK